MWKVDFSIHFKSRIVNEVQTKGSILQLFVKVEYKRSY